ncbi:hypothetical protein C7I36_00350 [Zobellella taiwanensis]|uniref:Lipocalin-like domain-containing protein n=1 Tax=Zobellella taiwanensis TaxID=347535 RepID=A0A2P7RDP5_9GAMM|nr:hypothetical protein [Zobellella taiwanensis]PSJ48310.1 hypothetical protein C7I36_00350 [Zobellella taiwanensis]
MNEFLGKWEIIEMEQWDQDYVDLEEPGFIRFDKDYSGGFVFGTVNGTIDYRYSKDLPPKVEFSWDGSSEYDPVSGRGWAVLEENNDLYGMLYIHDGDESWFKAKRM